MATLIAKRIIEVAQMGVRSPNRIRQRVLQSDGLECRRQADRCLQMAQSAELAQLKTLLMDMAQTWLTLARQTERLDALRENPAPRPVKVRPRLVTTEAR
jgi:hypothetical protein